MKKLIHNLVTIATKAVQSAQCWSYRHSHTQLGNDSDSVIRHFNSMSRVNGILKEKSMNRLHKARLTDLSGNQTRLHRKPLDVLVSGDSRGWHRVSWLLFSGLLVLALMVSMPVFAEDDGLRFCETTTTEAECFAEISSHPTAQWFQDAGLGVLFAWGPASVASFANPSSSLFRDGIRNNIETPFSGFFYRTSLVSENGIDSSAKVFLDNFCLFTKDNEMLQDSVIYMETCENNESFTYPILVKIFEELQGHQSSVEVIVNRWANAMNDIRAEYGAIGVKGTVDGYNMYPNVTFRRARIF